MHIKCPVMMKHSSSFKCTSYSKRTCRSEHVVRRFLVHTLELVVWIRMVERDIPNQRKARLGK